MTDASQPAETAHTTVAPEGALDYVGHLDKIGAGTVQGWVALRPDLARRVQVRIYLDGKLSAEGVAKDPRNDVRDAGFGDGLHGFLLPVPKKSLFCAKELVAVAVDADEIETAFHRRTLIEPFDRASPVLWMDASDLVEFLTHHRELSGIQRVQAGYLLGLGNATIAGTDCRICSRLKDSSFYFEIAYDRFVGLLRDAGDIKAVSAIGWHGYVKSFKESLTARANLRAGDTMFTMGAPWALDDHNETIRCTKHHFGAHYLQVFYDLIPISVPEVVAAPLIPHFARAMAAMSIYADHVFSISRYSRDDLAGTLRRLGRPVPPIDVIPMGGTITDAEKLDTQASGATVVAEIEGPFVLCVGTLEPRKNHMLLLQVWRRLVAQHGRDKVPKLVLVGRVGWYMEDFMRQLKITGFAERTIVHLQGVSNADLSALYDGCLFTIFPSFSEGWGLPITESLARGKVCVCSNVTSMPEAGGEHALYIDPFNVSAAYELCEKLIFDGQTLDRERARTAAFRAPTWAEASDGLRQQFADLVPRLAALPAKPPRKPIELGRTYKFYNIEAASPDASSTEVFANFLDQEDALDLLAGWHWFDLDVNCTWACGSQADFSLLLPEGELEVFVGLVVPPHCDGLDCEVFVDGATRGAFAVSVGTVTLRVPLVGDLAEHRVAIRLVGTRRLSADARLLGPGVANLVVFPKAQVADSVWSFQAGAAHVC